VNLSVRIAIAQMFAARQAGALIGLAAMIVLARLIDPEAFGVFALALALHGVFRALIAFGLKPRLVRDPSVDPPTIAAALGLSLTLSTLTCAMLGAAAQASLAPATLIGPLALLAASLLLISLAMPLEVALERDLRFRAISRVAVIGAASQAATSVILALAGFGAAALAAGVLADRAAILVGLAFEARRTDRAYPRPRFRGWGRFGVFGARLTTTELLPKAGEFALVSVLTAIGGAAAAGLFNRAEKVVKLFDTTVLDGMKPVVLPAFSRSLERGVAPAALYVLKVDHLTALLWPAAALTALLATPIIAVLLGPAWSDAAPLAQALALTGLAKPFTGMSLKLLVALDRTGEMLRISTRHAVLRLGFASLGALVSLEGACLGVALALLVKAVFIARAMKRATGYAARDVLRAVGRGAFITAATVAGPVAVATQWTDAGNLATLVAAVALAAPGWLAAVLLSGHPLAGELGRGVAALRRALAARRPVRAGAGLSR
jgi:O-antigen/teichoic acid export membrane protein